MITEILLIILSLGLLVLGGDWLVKGGVGLAKRFGVSSLMIGVTVIAWGTSTPELLVSIDAAMAGSPGIAVGNVVGSNIANILLILGMAAVVYPITVSPQAIKRDGTFALVAVVIFIIAALAFAEIGRLYGIAMLLILGGMAWYTYTQEKTKTTKLAVAGSNDALVEADTSSEVEEVKTASTLGGNLAWLVAGLGLLMLGADILVDNAIVLAKGWGVSDTVIGLTIVAVGTSLPELFTSVMAALRRHSDVALGNVIGSNIYNIMAILGIAGIISPVPVPAQIISVDMWIMLGVTLLVLPALAFGNRIGRVYGALFMLLYVAYSYWLFLHAPA